MAATRVGVAERGTPPRALSQAQLPAVAGTPCSCRNLVARARRRRTAPAGAAMDPLAMLAATDPALVQDLIVGGAVTAAVSAAIVSGLKKDPTPCDLCMGTGGTRCFGCEGAGNAVPADVTDPTKPPKRDFVGRTRNPRACRVCGGTGLVLCRKCKGSGYLSTF